MQVDSSNFGIAPWGGRQELGESKVNMPYEETGDGNCMATKRERLVARAGDVLMPNRLELIEFISL